MIIHAYVNINVSIFDEKG